MKTVSFIIIIFLASSCSSENNTTIICKQVLRDKSIVELHLKGGGATTDDVIWVRQTTKSEKKYIGKIKWYLEGFDSQVSQVNDSIIKITLTDTSTFKGTSKAFTLNLNNRIHFNDGSSYAE